MKKLTYLITLCALSLTIFAQNVPVISLKDAINKAIKNNDMLKVEKYKIDEAKADYNYAKSQFFPNIDFKTVYTKSDEPGNAAFFKTMQGDFTMPYMAIMDNPPAVKNYNTEFSFGLPIWMGGRLRLGKQMARLNIDVNKLNYLRKEKELIFNVTKAYQGIIMAKAVVALAKDSLKSAKEHVKIARDMQKAGLVVKSDVLRAEVFEGDMEKFLIDAKNNLKIAKLYLLNLMGEEKEYEFKINEELRPLYCKYKDFDEMVKIALENRRDYKMLLTKLKIVNKMIKMKKAERYPNVMAFAKYDLNDPKKFFKGQGEGYTAGVMAELKILDSGKIASQLEKLYKQKKQLEHAIQAMKKGISLQVKQNFLKMLTAQKNIEVATRSKKQAEESLRITKDRYKQGLTPFVSVIDAQTAFNQSRMQYIQAIYNYNIERESVKLSAGLLGDEIKIKNILKEENNEK